MAYVYKKGGKWYAGWKNASGAPDQECTGIPVGANPTQERANKRKATAYAEDKELQAKRIREGLDKPKKPEVLFALASRRYLSEYAKQLDSYDTVQGRFENHWIPARARAGEPTFGERFVSSICAADIEAVLLQKKDDYSPQTRRHLLNSLSGFFTWAITKAKLLEDGAENPCVHIHVAVPKRDPRPLKAEWVYPIIQCFDDYDRAFAATAVMTGARAGELRHARVGDVDLERCAISITGSNTRNTTKDKEERVIGFPPELIPYLQLELGRARSEWLFPSRDGKQRRKDEKLAEQLRAAMVKAGIIEGYEHRCAKRKCGYVERRADDAMFPCPNCARMLHVVPVPPHYTFRDLRATWATIAGAQTKDWKAVQFQLGHADPRTTQRYERVGDDRVLGQARTVRFLPRPTTSGDQQASYQELTGTDGGALEDDRQGEESPEASGGCEMNAGHPSEAEHRLRRPMLYPAELRAYAPTLSTTSQRLDIAEAPSAEPARDLAAPRTACQQVTYPALTGRLLTAQEAADQLRVARDTVYGWCKAGYLRSVRIAGAIRIRPEDLEAMQLPASPPALRGATAANAAKTHCPKGHPLDGVRSDGHRYCKTCNNLRGERRRTRGGR